MVVYFSSVQFGRVEVEFVQRNPTTGDEVQLLRGQVHLPYLVYHSLLWHETCAMWGMLTVLITHNQAKLLLNSY